MSVNVRLNINDDHVGTSRRPAPRISRRRPLLRCRFGFHAHVDMRWVGERLVSDCVYCGASLERDAKGWRESASAVNSHLSSGSRWLVALTRGALVNGVARLLGSGAR